MKVFVSSTYVDLVAHRSAVADALDRLGLQVSHMEAFGAQPSDPMTACLDAIEESELFVGIYAHRYGYIPDEVEVSITETEFEHAFQLRRPTFCFLVDDNYPWSKHFIDTELRATKLRSFKQRIETLVVRDLFTTPDVLATRVASSVGRFLIADPRRHGARSAADYARLTLADVAPATFVDLMRLAGYAASAEVRVANAGRHREFVDIADQHFSNFRNQVTRLSTGAEFHLMQEADAVERGIAHLLTRLRRDGVLDRPWADFLALLHNLSERVEALVASVSAGYLAERRSEFGEVYDAITQQTEPSELIASPLTFVRLRHAAQSRVLAHMQRSSGFVIASVRDDADLRLALPYFMIDQALLRSVSGLFVSRE